MVAEESGELVLGVGCGILIKALGLTSLSIRRNRAHGPIRTNEGHPSARERTLSSIAASRSACEKRLLAMLRRMR